VKHIQAVHFPDEVDILQRGEVLPRSSPLLRLTPFLDKDGLVRVGGRLNNADVEYDFMHPYILPTNSPLSSLLINDTHQRTLHGGVQLTLSTLRQKFWIIGGRAPVRSFILRCVRCARQRGIAAKQMMGQLPKLRTTPSRPFLHAGVDYAGPYTMRTWRGRGGKTYKAYIIIFICFATSAMHLEIASDYSSEGFLSAYRRFAGRRGVCASITSDCGSNLVGADNELKKLFDKASEEFARLRSVLAADRTKWIFNPPSAPHFGGFWEAGVKATKFHLRRVIGEAKLTYEEFSCVLTQIEGVLNSRPLCPLSEDPSDLSALTPGHFLVGGPINAIPEPSLSHLPECRLSRWQKVRQMTERFWERWSKEYLQKMQAVSKWHHPSNTLSEGSLVLIVDERYPPSKWPLVRLTKLHKGTDGLVRVATVRTADGEFLRPVVKLCV